MPKKPSRSKGDHRRHSEASGGAGALILILVLASLVYKSKHDDSGPQGAATMREMVRCPNVEEDEVGHLLCRLPLGVAAFNAPATMTRGEPQVISLVITVRDSTRRLMNQVREGSGDSTSKVVVDTVRISSRMVARLEGQGFDITPKAADAVPVAVPTARNTEWDWQVKPTAEGDQLLVLTLDAMIPMKAGDTPVRQTVLRRRIHVNVRVWDRVGGWADWAVAHWPILAAIAVVIGAIPAFKRMKRKWFRPK